MKFGIIVVIVIIVGLATWLVPIAGIWALNTLIGSEYVPVTLKTWFAMSLIIGAMAGSGYSSKK